MKKILILGDANSYHILKWASGIASKGYKVNIFSLTQPVNDILKNNGIEVHYASYAGKRKFLYPLAVDELLRLIKDYKPDIVHAHYASSYGLLGALSWFHPFVLSVWGSDVFDFPKISFLHKLIFKFNLRRADMVCSTSHVMETETRKYTSKHIKVIPFGVDIDVFKPVQIHHAFKDNAIIIGTVKALEKKYGIEYLIDAFDIVRKKLKDSALKLIIVGKGTLDVKLRSKVKDMGLESSTIFTGYISPSEIPSYQNMITIPVFPSIDDSESFGVSAVEAMACEKPVIVSNVGGLPEVVENNITGLVVSPANAGQLAEAMEKLIQDEALRLALGKQGRQRVVQLYNWQNNLDAMMNIYEGLSTSQ